MGVISTTSNTTMSDLSFWKTIEILFEKPHVINKSLWGCTLLFRCFGKCTSNNWIPPLQCERIDQSNIEKYKLDVFKQLQVKPCQEFEKCSDYTLEIVLLQLLPKRFTLHHAFQLACLIKKSNRIIFYNISPDKSNSLLCPEFTYSLQLDSNKLTLKCFCDHSSKSYAWLVQVFLPQFIKWGEEMVTKVYKTQRCKDSLSLVSKEKYYNKYNELKLKYGKEMVKIWPECTDPSKFVYEDVAIAAYLLLLWENEEEKFTKKSFVDLGCGNGLLVFILHKEGHKGIGIDVRRRQIWDLYTNDIVLEERTIVPSDANLFPEADWIIGNHSDELTPWIPVIAARSSYKCNFFLLPCCAYNFDGTKYQRKDSSKSQYNEYLEYINQLCNTCGFNTTTDRLKIPSTKRICFIGCGRTYNEKGYNQYCDSIKDLLGRETHSQIEIDNPCLWVKKFKPRDSVERVRNCTQIDKAIVESLVNDITKYLLQGICLEGNWSTGKHVHIHELIQAIPQDRLNVLKAECGGLQTLLKNNNHIFKVQSGKVQIRYPRTIDEIKDIKRSKQNTSTIKIQQRPCWFYNEHPQGCPLTDSNCSFLHTKGK